LGHRQHSSGLSVTECERSGGSDSRDADTYHSGELELELVRAIIALLMAVARRDGFARFVTKLSYRLTKRTPRHWTAGWWRITAGR
jgi:hypothetical protein